MNNTDTVDINTINLELSNIISIVYSSKQFIRRRENEINDLSKELKSTKEQSQVIENLLQRENEELQRTKEELKTTESVLKFTENKVTQQEAVIEQQKLQLTIFQNYIKVLESDNSFLQKHIKVIGLRADNYSTSTKRSMDSTSIQSDTLKIDIKKNDDVALNKNDELENAYRKIKHLETLYGNKECQLDNVKHELAEKEFALLTQRHEFNEMKLNFIQKNLHLLKSFKSISDRIKTS